MKKVLVLLRLFFSSCCLAVFFQLSHGTELYDLSIPVSADRQNVVADVGSLSGRILGQLVLPEKLGIDHPDQVVDFDYSADTRPFYVAEADGTVIHHQRLSDGKLALRARGGLLANETRQFRIVSGTAPSEPADEADSVRVVETAEHYEVANAFVAVRVPRAISAAQPSAPIRAVRLRDGVWHKQRLAAAGLWIWLVARRPSRKCTSPSSSAVRWWRPSRSCNKRRVGTSRVQV